MTGTREFDSVFTNPIRAIIGGVRERCSCYKINANWNNESQCI